MHHQLRNPQHTYVKHAVCKAHYNSYRAFKVILIGAGRNPENCVIVCTCN